MNAAGVQEAEVARTPRRYFLVAAIVVIAFNLRPALASVGPLVGEIRADTSLSHAALGLLTTLPLLAFGVVSTLTPFVTRALGLGSAITISLGLISVGALVRGAPSISLLFAGTTLLGIGIALGNVLLPVLVKRDFAHRSGSMTSLYSSALALGASLAAGVSVPLARQIGWHGALAVWSVPAVVALVLWMPRRRAYPAATGTGARTLSSLLALGRSPLAWQVAAYMGLQSLTFYVILAWLPDLLQSRGFDPVHAGWMLAISQATGIFGSALVPMLAGRRRDQRAIVAGLAILEAIALAGIIGDAGNRFALVWVSTIGFVLGGTFGLSLLFLVVRSPDARTTTELSGMAQSIGYLIAATGPVLFGFLLDLSGSWTVPLVFLVFVLGTKVLAGLPAARPAYVRTHRATST